MIEPTGEPPASGEAGTPQPRAGDAESGARRGFMERLFGHRVTPPPAETSSVSQSEAATEAESPDAADRTGAPPITGDAAAQSDPASIPGRTEEGRVPSSQSPDASTPEAVVPSVVTPQAVEVPRFEIHQPAREIHHPTREGAQTGELGDQVQTGFNDLSRLLGAIKETLQSRDGQVQQTLRALPDFLQQVPRIHRAEIECLAQISKQLSHMGTGTRDVVARLDGLPDLLRSLMLGQAEQAKFLDNLQANVAETLESQGQALREGLDMSRRSSETQLAAVRQIASTQEDIFATFQNTQNRALNVFHRAQQQTISQSRDTNKIMNRQIEMLVDKVHVAQGRVFWLSIGFAALAAAGLLAVLFLS